MADVPPPPWLSLPAMVSAERDAEGNAWTVIYCPVCHADLSTVSLGRAIGVGLHATLEILPPLRCPECHEPLLPWPW